jgi:hypothetical protein
MVEGKGFTSLSPLSSYARPFLLTSVAVAHATLVSAELLVQIMPKVSSARLAGRARAR